MNNRTLVNNLKTRNINPGGIQQIKQNISKGTGIKYNPDVNERYNVANNNRQHALFTYSEEMWKPIIGSVNKKTITKNDMKINIAKPDINQIMSKYDLELNERNKEMELAKKILDEQNRNKIMNEIKKPIENKTIGTNDTFIELKASSNKCVQDLKLSTSNINELINTVKNL